jgi:hypothetical protein
MKTGREESPTEQWRELYKAAVFETDKNKLSERIDEAQTALLLRMRELFHSRENIHERQAVDVAISALRMLRSATAHTDKRQGGQRPRSDAAHAA